MIINTVIREAFVSLKTNTSDTYTWFVGGDEVTGALHVL